MLRWEEERMATIEKELTNKKLEAVDRIQNRVQAALKRKGLTGEQVSKMVGIKRYEG